MANFSEVMDLNQRSVPVKGKGGVSTKSPVGKIEYEKALNGGHVFTHHAPNSPVGDWQKPKVFSFGKDDAKGALAHFADHSGLNHGVEPVRNEEHTDEKLLKDDEQPDAEK